MRLFLFVFSFLFMSLKTNCFSQSFSTVGNGTTSNTQTEYPAPYGQYYEGAKHQFFISASELSAAGIFAGATIMSLGFNVTADNTVTSTTHNGFQILVFNVGSTTDPLSVGYITTGQVSSSTPINFNPITGWNQHTLSQFTWDGTSNLVIQSCFNNNVEANIDEYTNNAQTQWTSTLLGTSIKSRYYRDDNVSAICPSTETDVTSSSTRPNIRFGWAAASNDLVCNATPTSCGQTLSGSTINSTLSGTNEGISCGNAQTMPGVWFSIQGNGQTITASLCGTSSWDSKISVFSGSSCSVLTCVGGIDDNGPSCSGTPASYSWNSVSGLNYFILVHGYNTNNSFSLSLSCTANVPSNPILISILENSGNAVNNGIICSGESAQLSVSGSSGTTYWFSEFCGNSISSSVGSGISLNVSPSLTTTYYARNYSNGLWSSGCVSMTITVVSALTPSIPTSNSPQCNSVTITRSGTPPTGTTWYWQGTTANGTSSSLGSGATYTASSSGTYYIRASSSGCWSSTSGSIAVTVTSTPLTPSTPTSNSPQCNSVTITRSGTPPTGTTWYWQGTTANGTSSSLGSGATYTASSSGTYYIRASSSGCWSSTSGSIAIIISENPSTPLINTTTATCNSSGSASITNYNVAQTYIFSPLGPTVGTNGAILGLSPNINYYVTALNSSSCQSAPSNIFSIAPILLVPSIPAELSSSSSQNFCDSILITINSNPPNGVIWYWQDTNSIGTSISFGTGNSYYAQITGIYYLRALNSNGCWSNTSSSIQIFTGRPENPTNPLSNIPQCDTVIINFNGSPSNGETWYWQEMNPYSSLTIFGSTDSLVITSSGTYYLRALNQLGCWSLGTGSIQVNVGVPSGDTNIINTTALDYFLVQGQIFTETGSYVLTLQDQFGCDSIVQLNLVIENLSTNNFDNLVLSIYPNPSSVGKFFIKSMHQIELVELIDFCGRKVPFIFQNNLLDISQLSKGIYMLTIIENEKFLKVKIIHD